MTLTLQEQAKAVKSFNEGDIKFHFANFVDAVRSRDAGNLNADILEGHLSSALCHLVLVLLLRSCDGRLGTLLSKRNFHVLGVLILCCLPLQH